MEEAAAFLIQACFRRRRANRKVLQLNQDTDDLVLATAAVRIQRAFRVRRARKELLKRKAAKNSSIPMKLLSVFVFLLRGLKTILFGCLYTFPKAIVFCILYAVETVILKILCVIFPPFSPVHSKQKTL